MDELKYLLNNHFQILNTEKIKFNFHKEKDSFAYITGSSAAGHTISFSKKDYNRMTRNQILGVLSHELAHIYYEKTNGFVFTLFKNILYFSSKKYKIKEERKVDLIVIKNGCGQYLLEFIKYHDKHYKKYKRTDGLTKKEIKKALKKIVG